MSAEPSKGLLERRAELEKQLRKLTEKGTRFTRRGGRSFPSISQRQTNRPNFRLRNCRRPSPKSMKG